MASIFNPVSIVSVGAITSVGLTAPTTAAAVRAGIAGFYAHPFLVDSLGDQMIVATVPTLSPDKIDEKRLVELALPAANEALAAFQTSFPLAMPFVLGFPSQRPGTELGVVERITRHVAQALSHSCEITATSTVPLGHVAGLVALVRCGELMREYGSEFGLVGAIDSYINAECLEWLEAQERLHNARNPYGFIPGEAAGFFIVATKDGLGKLKQPPLLQIRNVSLATEYNVCGADTVCTGVGLSDCVRQALRALPRPLKVDSIICDLNGEQYRADEYSFTIPRISELCVDAVAFQSPADCWGDVGAASGALFLVLASIAAKKRYANGAYTLVWTSSDDGQRAAALLVGGTEAHVSER